MQRCRDWDPSIPPPRQHVHDARLFPLSLRRWNSLKSFLMGFSATFFSALDVSGAGRAFPSAWRA